MNRIQMYASSSHLKHGLHRTLAVAYALTCPFEPGLIASWWSVLAPDDQEDGRLHRLALAQLADVYDQATIRDLLDAGREAVGLGPLDHDAVQAAFGVAVISGKAHRAHMGRDVYGSSNKVLWGLVCDAFGSAVAEQYGPALGDDPVPISDSAPSPEALRIAQALTRFDTSPRGPDHEACVDWLVDQLQELGFSVRVLRHHGGRPLLEAHRPAQGMHGHVGVYGHYDVTPFGREEMWAHPPRQLTLADQRIHARGIADNKGPLACRLAALPSFERTPALTWLIQGEEETGSTVARALFPTVMRDLRPTLWLDETGYHDHEDGTLRLLARTMGVGDSSLPPDSDFVELLRSLGGLASRWGVAARHECRGLNKSVVEGGCPFNHTLAEGERYLAIGVNDSSSGIHGLNESLPGWTFPLHAAELGVIFHWVDRLAGSVKQ